MTDAKGASATAEVVVTVLENLPPAVSATAAPRTVLGGGTVTLDGTATDLEDDALSHAWSSNGGGTFADDSAPDTTWTAPEPTQADQVVTLTLTVTDAKGASATAEVVVTVLENQPPAVSATAAPRTVLGGGTVTLDGTATDLEDDALSHAWSSNGGGTFADDSAPDTTWTAPEPTQADQVVTLTLTVTDAKGASATAEVVVTVLENQPPAVSATAAPRTVLGGGTVTLDGTATDLEDDALSHAWSSNGGGTFADDSAPDTTWTAPEATQADQVVTLTLTVTDAKGASATAEVVVTVLENQPPAVSATAAPRTVLGGGTVTLDGTATDLEDDALSHAWSSNGGGTFADDSAPDTTWTAPEATQADQVVTLTLTVTDAKGASATAEVVVTVLENQPPRVWVDNVSGGFVDFEVEGLGTIMLDGRATDPEDDTLSHAWSSNGGGTFADDSAPDTTWTAPEPTQADQVVTLTLTVTDAKGASATAEVVVTVLENQPPRVWVDNVSGGFVDFEVEGLGTIMLDGRATDPEDDALSYAWSSNGGGTFADDSAPDTTWTAPRPTATGFDVFLTLTVTDAKGAGTSYTVVATVLSARPPDAATNLQATADKNSVLLTWTLPSSQPADVTVASAEVQQRRSGTAWTTVATLAASATSRTVAGLEEETEYFFRIRLTATSGVFSDSDRLRVRTLGDAPPGHFAAYWPTQTSVTLSWWTLETAVEYKLELRRAGDGEWTRIRGDFDHLPSATDLRQVTGVAAGLECDTLYRFRVSARGDGTRYPAGFFGSPAVTSARTGECAQEEQQEEQEEEWEEEEVTNLLVSIEPDCATLTWTPPAGDRDTGYRVQRYSYTGRATGDWQRTPRVTLVEVPASVAARYEDCSPAYRTDGAEHVYIVSALDGDGEEFGRGVHGDAEGRPRPRARGTAQRALHPRRPGRQAPGVGCAAGPVAEHRRDGARRLRAPSRWCRTRGSPATGWNATSIAPTRSATGCWWRVPAGRCCATGPAATPPRPSPTATTPATGCTCTGSGPTTTGDDPCTPGRETGSS